MAPRKRGKSKSGLSVLDGGVYPWEQREGETAKQHAVFMIYANMDPLKRSVIGAARLHRQRAGENTEDMDSHQRAHSWAKTHEWEKRAIARDKHLERIRFREKEQAVKEKAREEAIDVEEMRRTLYNRFQAINDSFDESVRRVLEDPRGISIQGLTQLMRLQLDILRHFDEGAVSTDAEAERKKKERQGHAEKLFGGSAGS